jgi:hypothetical protein
MPGTQKHILDIERELLDNIAFIESMCKGENPDPPETLKEDKSLDKNFKENIDILKNMGIDFGEAGK